MLSRDTVGGRSLYRSLSRLLTRLLARGSSRRLIQMLPNILTISNLFLGFSAILLILEGTEYHLQAIFLIFAGMITDGLDGRVARRFNTQSSLGEHLDSLADVVTFGVAPAVVFHTSVSSAVWNGSSVLGGMAVMVFVACGALRLARFHAQPSPPGGFIGLPIPAAGGALAALSLATHTTTGMYLLTLLGAVCLATLMVSRVRYPKIRKFRLRGSNLLLCVLFLIIVAIVAVCYAEVLPQVMMVPLAFYICYGIVVTFRRRRWRDEDKETAEEWK